MFSTNYDKKLILQNTFKLFNFFLLYFVLMLKFSTHTCRQCFYQKNKNKNIFVNKFFRKFIQNLLAQ